MSNSNVIRLHVVPRQIQLSSVEIKMILEQKELSPKSAPLDGQEIVVADLDYTSKNLGEMIAIAAALAQRWQVALGPKTLFVTPVDAKSK